jgi:sec-independent protein translocase protein TatA
MFGLGVTEVVVIGIVGILLFGNRLPTIARSVGSSFVQFKKGLNDVEDEVKEIKKELK